MCPLSNLELQVTPDLAKHPLKRLLDAGLRVTVNSDDPAYFDGYLAANYSAVQRALGLDRGDIAALARNSITASWLPPARQNKLLAEIDAFVAAAG
jgi:adenosine deaminase